MMYIGREISELYRMANVFLTKKFSKFGIGAGQYLFLARIYNHEGISQEELSDELNIDKATTARAVIKLEEQGYIIRRKLESDRRVNLIFSTDKAKDFKTEFFSILNQWNDKLMEPLTEEEKGNLLFLIGKVSKNINGREGVNNE